MQKNTASNRTCLYCKSVCEGEALKCRNCGAPVVEQEAATFDARSCPYCRRKLLALASPACNYCGLHLPEHFIRHREEQLRRMAHMNGPDHGVETKDKIEKVLRIAGKPDRKANQSMLDLVNWVDLTDLFS